MAQFPSAIPQAPPPIVGQRFDVLGKQVGQMFNDLTTAIVKIPQDVKAYETLKKKEANIAQFKNDLVEGVLADIGQDWDDNQRRMFLSSVKNSKDIDELVSKGSTLYLNRQYQNENELSLVPLWGQRDYISFVAPWKDKVTKQKEAELTGKQVEAIGEPGVKTREQATREAIQAGGFEPLTTAAQQLQKTVPPGITPHQKERLALDEIKKAATSKKDIESKLEQIRDNKFQLTKFGESLKNDIIKLGKNIKDIEEDRFDKEKAGIKALDDAITDKKATLQENKDLIKDYDKAKNDVEKSLPKGTIGKAISEAAELRKDLATRPGVAAREFLPEEPAPEPKPAGPEEAPPPEAKKTIPALPRIGEVRKGYRFKGGDPRKSKNWEKV